MTYMGGFCEVWGSVVIGSGDFGTYRAIVFTQGRLCDMGRFCDIGFSCNVY